MLNKVDTYLKIDRKKFLNILQSLKKVAPTKTTDSCWQRALIFYEKKAVYVAAANSEQALKLKLCDQEIAIPKTDFDLFTVLDFMRKSKSQDIEIGFDNDGVITINAGNITFMDTSFEGSMWEFEQFEIDYYDPEIPCEFICCTAHLLKVFSDISYAISDEATRPYLNGVYIQQADDNSLDFVACDGYRLSRRVLTPKKSEDLTSVLIPKEVVRYFLDFSKKQLGEVKVNISKNLIVFTMGDMTLASEIMDFKYPDFQHILVRNNNVELTLNKEVLLENLDVFTIQKRTNLPVIFSYDAQISSLKLERNVTNKGALEAHIDCENNGPKSAEDIFFCLNPDYLKETLESIDSQRVRIYLQVIKRYKDSDGEATYEFDQGPLEFTPERVSHIRNVDILMPKRP